MWMKVSILIPTYNEEATITQTLKHAKRQRFPQSYEILVADGGSTDRTIKLVESSDVTVLRCPKKGKVDQLNYAARKATGEILFLIDADTLIPVNYLERVCQFLDQHQDVVACGVRFKYTDGRIHQWRLGQHTFKITVYEPISWGMALWYIIRDLLNFTELPGCNICVRREAFFTVGGLPSVPNNRGIDAAFSYELRHLTNSRGRGRQRYLLVPSVLTSSRFLSVERSKSRLKQIQRYVDSQKNST
jgi:glycosyltransferase involved in cell wall biosynthesis